MENKKGKLTLYALITFCSLAFVSMSVFFLFYMIMFIHPGIEASEDTGNKPSYDLNSRVNDSCTDMKNTLLSDYLSSDDIIRKIYRIEKGAPVPVPNQNAYNTLEIADINNILPVIDDARKCGLLTDDEQLAFKTDAPFYNNKPVQYYFDSTILVICWKELIDGKVVTFSEVKINDPSQFRRKLTEDKYGSSVKKYCSALSKESNAVVAYNADFYAFRNLGITCYDGTVYRAEQSLDILFIDENGDFIFYNRKNKDDKDTLQKYVDDNHIQFSLAFGPIIIKDGQALDNVTYPIGEISQIYPRAGIGQMGPLHYLYMTVDNYGENHRPCTVNQFTGFMASKGVINGYNLDGGQTGELVFNNKIFNFISYNNERDVSDIIYFATAFPENER